jgi:hypothetical protein
MLVEMLELLLNSPRLQLREVSVELEILQTVELVVRVFSVELVLRQRWVAAAVEELV